MVIVAGALLVAVQWVVLLHGFSCYVVDADTPCVCVV